MSQSSKMILSSHFYKSITVTDTVRESYAKVLLELLFITKKWK